MSESGEDPAANDQLGVNGLLKDLGELLDSGDIENGTSPTPSDVVPTQSDAETTSGRSAVGLDQLYDRYDRSCTEVERLEKANKDLTDRIVALHRENDQTTIKFQETTSTNAAKIAELERRILELEYHLKAARDRSSAQEIHHKKSVEDLNTKHSLQLDQLKKSTEKAQKEKDTAVIKFASREKEILDLKAQLQKVSATAQQMTTERDALNARLRGAKNERDRFIQQLEQKDSELAEVRKKLAYVETFQSEAEIKVKMAAKRVDDVEEQHKVTKVELEKTMKRLKEAKEEAETIRANCNRMIQQYQESEEFKSNSLDKELNAKVQLMKVQQQEQSDQEEIYKVVTLELEAVKKQHKMTLKDLEDLKSQLRGSERETAEQERKVIDCQCTIDVQSKKVADLERELVLMKQIVSELEREKTTRISLESQLAELHEYNDDLKRDADTCRSNAEKNLEINQQLTESISKLQAHNTSVNTELEACKEELKNLRCHYDQLKLQFEDLTSAHETLQQSAKQSEDRLEMEVQLKVHREKELQRVVEDEQNRNKVLQKKHLAAVKELKSEVMQLKKRLDSYEAGTASQCSVGSEGNEDAAASNHSNHSRTPSVSSLSETGLASNQSSSTAKSSTLPDPGGSVHFGQNNPMLHSAHNQTLSDQNQLIVEKIVKLQRLLARRTEKLEFLEEHVRQLIAEAQRKSRIIQMYALREETGALAPPTTDLHKAEMSKRGLTVMGMLFSGSSSDRFGVNPHDSSMTLDLSVQINRKLQCVLEDILLKNIMMKENLNTLGAEISKLSRENRELQLQLTQRNGTCLEPQGQR